MSKILVIVRKVKDSRDLADLEILHLANQHGRQKKTEDSVVLVVAVVNERSGRENL